MRHLLGWLIVFAVAACATGVTGDDYQAAAEEATARPLPGSARGEFRPVPAVTPLAPAKFEYGDGGCETRYADGTRGTCINGEACNGFGFRDAHGTLICACFEVIGGCAETQACNPRRRACVMRSDIDLQRPPPR